MKIEELKGAELVKDYSDEIERMLGSKMKSVKVRRSRKSGREGRGGGGKLQLGTQRRSNIVFFLFSSRSD